MESLARAGILAIVHTGQWLLSAVADLALPPVANGVTAGTRSTFWKRSQWAVRGANFQDLRDAVG